MFKKKLDKNLIMSIQPTSIASLKSQCYIIADGDIDEAKKLYDYFISDMENLPMFEPKEPSKMEKVKAVLGEGVGWVKENQDGLMQAIQMAKMLFSKGGGGVTAGAGSVAQQAINDVAEAATTAPIPPIN